MTTLVQHVDPDRLIAAIRQDLIPSHAAIRAAEAVDAALGAYRAPSLEARRLAEEAAGAVKESLSVLAAVVLPVSVPRRAQPRAAPQSPAPAAAPPPPFDVLALAPLACALAALPLQGGPLGSLLVLAAAAGSGVMVWRSYNAPPPAAPAPVFLLPSDLPPPPPATLQPEAVAAAVRRALGQIDDLVAFSERRRVARAEPSTLNDTTLEFLQDLAEAALRGRAEFALAKIEFRLPVVLEACDLTALDYSPATAAHFDIDGDPAHAATRRPALLTAGRCVKRGLAAARTGRG